MMMNRSRGAVALLAMLACAVSTASAQGNYPNRPVKMLVGFSPGGAVDSAGREVAKGLSALWGQSVIVENKLGAAGMIALEATVKAAPDGYTLLLTADGPLVSVPFLQDKAPYDMLTDLTPIAMVGGFSLILVAHEPWKVKTLPEFIAAAKARPGAIAYGSSGIGTSPHLAMELLQRAAGIKLNHIPYKGGPASLQDVMAGHVSVVWSGMSTALTQVQSGKRLVPLAVSSLERSALFPAVPTVAELGFPGFEAGNWVAVMAPAKLPKALAQSLEADLRQVTQTEAYRKRLATIGIEARTSTSDELARRIRTESSRNKALLSGAKTSK